MTAHASAPAAPGDDRRAAPGAGVLVLMLVLLLVLPALAGGPARAATAVVAVVAAAMAAPVGPGAALLAERTAQQAALRDSPFGVPLLLRTREDDELDAGELIGELAQPLARVAEVFQSAASVCSLLLLHLNVRDCEPGPDGAAQVLAVSAGPMRERMPGLVYGVNLQLRTELLADGSLSVVLASAGGAQDTRPLRLDFAAVAIDAGRSFFRLRFAHDVGLAERMAARLYLATAGRAKIGFTLLAPGADGVARPIRGQRAALERNVMRHYLALLAHAGVTTGTPRQRMDARLRAWHALTERHAAQLHELDLADYLHEKQGALARAAALGR